MNQGTLVVERVAFREQALPERPVGGRPLLEGQDEAHRLPAFRSATRSEKAIVAVRTSSPEYM